MIIAICGEDNFRSFERLKELKKEYQKNDFRVFVFDFSKSSLEENSWENLKTMFFNRGLFEEKKLIIVEDLIDTSFKDKVKELSDILKKNNEVEEKNIAIVFYERDTLKKSVLPAWLSKNIKANEEFKILKGNDLIKYVKDCEQKLDVKFSPEARTALLMGAESDVSLINNVLQKASLLQLKQVNVSDLAEIFKGKWNIRIFDLLDSLVESQVKRSLSLIDQLILDGSDPIFDIFPMIIFQARNLLMVKSEPEKGTLGLNPFVYKKAKIASFKFSLSELKTLYRLLSQYDFQIKTGKIQPRLAIELIAIQFTKKSL
ncbi:MAG: hypothetical protein NTW73_02340 [Candidatus Parcubacteria bacterium]|nr:hypothetical protein [Candidatus Parcubacteria bacterium]